MLTSSQKSRATSAARSKLHASPFRPFVDVVTDIFHEVTGMRVTGSIEHADAATQAAWFEAAGITAGVRVYLLQHGRLADTAHEHSAVAVEVAAILDGER